MDTVLTLPWWFSALVTLITGATVIGLATWKLAKPHVEKYVCKLMGPAEERITKIEELVESHSEMNGRDLRRFEAIEKQNKIILKALFAMLSHMRDGNNTGYMDKVIKELQSSLIES